jgi:hypothetical protein
MVFKKFLIFVSILLAQITLVCLNTLAQASPTVTVKGVIVDKNSGDPLPFADIRAFKTITSKYGAVSDNEGTFSITVPDTTRFLLINCVGYEKYIYTIDKNTTQYVKISLNPELKKLSEFTVIAKRKRYRNKNRVSVQLIDKVIEHKSSNRPENFNYLQYQRYQKTAFSFVNLKDKITDSKLLEPFSFIFDNKDTSMVPGKTLIPVYIKETISDMYSRKNPHSTKELIEAENLIRFDEQVNRRSVSASINYLYADVNIYDNNINMLSNQFLSPIASMAPSFYKYFLKDTVFIDGIKCARLTFEPRNTTDMLFEGTLYVTLDSTYAVKKLSMTVNKAINLNWVRDVQINQKFEKVYPAGWILKTDQMGADFGITQESFGVYGMRTCMYKDFVFNTPQVDSLYKEPVQVYLEGSEDKDLFYWENNRFAPLRPSEENIFTLMDSLKQVPQFKRDITIISTLSGGFYKTKYFEFGLYSTFYSYNPIEGSRFKMGGRTTNNFSKKWIIDPYVAYGTHDNQFKYGSGITYNFTNKTVYDYPLKTVKVGYQYDIKIPGQELQYTSDDNLLISLRRGTNNKMYYNRVVSFEHLNEFQNHFSYKIKYEFSTKTPTGDLYFNNSNYEEHINTTSSINVGEAELTLRYAPHEKFFQGTVYRTPFVNKYPVFQLQLMAASKALGSDYNYQNIQLSISKRFYMSFLGFSDVYTEFGKTFGSVPYLLLNIHRANQSYSYDNHSYNLMNFLEFASDQYAAVFVDHCFYGFFFNKIPLLKKLKFREVVSFKALYGGITDQNNPNLHPDLFKFPTSNGTPLTYSLEKKPYMEVGVGVSNIFRVFRVDYIQRLSYLNNPGVTSSGIRFSYKFDF